MPGTADGLLSHCPTTHPLLCALLLPCLLHQAELGYDAGLLEKIDITEPVVPLPKAALPPYNGYGTLDDSKQNCVALVPKPPKKVGQGVWGGPGWGARG